MRAEVTRLFIGRAFRAHYKCLCVPANPAWAVERRHNCVW